MGGTAGGRTKGEGRGNMGGRGKGEMGTEGKREGLTVMKNSYFGPWIAGLLESQ